MYSGQSGCLGFYRKVAAAEEEEEEGGLSGGMLPKSRGTAECQGGRLGTLQHSWLPPPPPLLLHWWINEQGVGGGPAQLKLFLCSLPLSSPLPAFPQARLFSRIGCRSICQGLTKHRRAHRWTKSIILIRLRG